MCEIAVFCVFVGGGGGGAWCLVGQGDAIQQLRVQTFRSSIMGGLEVKFRVPFFGH